MKKQLKFWLLVMMAVFCLGMITQAENHSVGCRAVTIKEEFQITENWEIVSNRDWVSAVRTKTGYKLKISTNEGEARKATVKIYKLDEAGARTGRIQKFKIEQAAYDPILCEFKYDWLSANKRDVTKKFLKKVIKIAKGLGVTPDDLMTVMAFESGLDHQAVNRISNATGLIQFLPSTAGYLGTNVAALKRMSAVKQLNYVEMYLKQFGTMQNLGDLYMAILWPRGVHQKNSYVLWYSGSVEYQNNKGLDANGDGKITRKECLILVLNARKRFVGA